MTLEIIFDPNSSYKQWTGGEPTVFFTPCVGTAFWNTSLKEKQGKGHEWREDEEDDVSSYWATLRRKKRGCWKLKGAFCPELALLETMDPSYGRLRNKRRRRRSVWLSSTYKSGGGRHWLTVVGVQLKCDGTRWRTGGEVKGKLANCAVHLRLKYSSNNPLPSIKKQNAIKLPPPWLCQQNHVLLTCQFLDF